MIGNLQEDLALMLLLGFMLMKLLIEMINLTEGGIGIGMRKPETLKIRPNSNLNFGREGSVSGRRFETGAHRDSHGFFVSSTSHNIHLNQMDTGPQNFIRELDLTSRKDEIFFGTKFSPFLYPFYF
ncbi:hypothetical protein ACJX0J_005604, partial [Zea mays]